MESESSSVQPRRRLGKYKVALGHSTPNPPAKVTEDTSPTLSSQMLEIGDEFCTSMDLLWQFTRSVGSASQQTQATNAATLTLLLLEMKAESAKGATPLAELNVELAMTDDQQGSDPEVVSARFPICTREHLARCHEFADRQRAALRILHQSSLQQMVNSFERLLAETLYGFLIAQPELLPKEKTLTYRQVLAFSTLEAAKSHVVYDEVDNFLRRKNTKEQIAYFKESLNVDLRQDCTELFDRVADVVLRRHAIVHAAKFAEAEYWRLRAKLGKLPAIDRDTIDVQNPSATEIRDAWDTIYAAGVIMCDKIGRSLARQASDTSQLEEVDSFLIRASFGCLATGRFGAAEQILRYAKTFRLQKETSNLVIAVNLAQSLMWQGKHDEAGKILKSHDWDACHAGFQLCVSALQNDETAFRSFLHEAARTKRVTLSEMYEWPVFRQMRSRPDYDNWVFAAFGITAEQKPKSSPFHVLRFDSRLSFDEVGDLLYAVVAPSSSEQVSATNPPASSATDSVEG